MLRSNIWLLFQSGKKDFFLALPFAALLDETDGKYLIEKYSLSVVPSLGTLLQLEEQQESGELYDNIAESKTITKDIYVNEGRAIRWWCSKC